MRLLISAVALAGVVLASGCRNPMPNFNPYAGMGSATVAPPPAGGYPAGSVPGRPDSYYPGFQQPGAMTAPGAAPNYAQPAPATTGMQLQNQQSVGTSGGWQATNSGSPAASTAQAGQFQSNTAVNRATTPNITNGTINDASFNGTPIQPATTGSTLLDRIQRGRMPVHDVTTPPGASVPVPAQGYPAIPGYPVPGYPAPGYPAVPAQPVYQIQPSMTAVPGYSQLRGAGLATSSPNPAAAAASAPTLTATSMPVERSVLVSTPSAAATSTVARTSSEAAVNSGDGLKWRSRQAPAMEVATR